MLYRAYAHIRPHTDRWYESAIAAYIDGFLELFQCLIVTHSITTW